MRRPTSPTILRFLIMGACAAGALLATAPVAAPAPSAGDQDVRRALRAVDRLDRVGESITAAVLLSGSGGVPRVVEAGERLRASSATAVRGLRATAPTSAQGRRMRRLGIGVALMHREAARMVVASQRALAAGDLERGGAFLVKALAIHHAIDTRTGAARRIVLPDPDAFVGSLTLVGVVSAGRSQTEEPLILAGDGGTMTRCDASDEILGWRVYALDIVGTSRATVVTTSPSGATDSVSSRIGPPVAGVEVTLPVKARGNGLYRLRVSQGARVLLDVSVTRACR